MTISSITLTPGTPCERITARLPDHPQRRHDHAACSMVTPARPEARACSACDAPFTITGGTGDFAGASGGGTAHDVLPGSAAGLNPRPAGGMADPALEGRPRRRNAAQRTE